LNLDQAAFQQPSFLEPGSAGLCGLELEFGAENDAAILAGSSLRLARSISVSTVALNAGISQESRSRHAGMGTELEEPSNPSHQTSAGLVK